MGSGVNYPLSITGKQQKNHWYSPTPWGK